MTTRYPTAWLGTIMIAVLMGTALVSPLYVLYQEAWQLSSGQVTQLYVIYMVGALVSLPILGRLADFLGFHRTLMLSLGLCLAGTILSALSGEFFLFATARFLVGVSASLATIGGAVALSALTPLERHRNLALMSSLFISFGFALGPIVGGIVGQWAPIPLVSAFLPGLLLALVGLGGLFAFLPRAPQETRVPSWRVFIPQLSWSDRKDSVRFGLVCCLPFISFGVFGLYASLAPLMIRDFLGLDGPMVSGAFIGLFLMCVAATQFAARRAPARKSALVSLILIAFGSVCMLVNVGVGSLWLFAIGVLIGSVGHGLSMLASTSVLVEISRAENRGALTSTYWAIGYSGSIFPLLLLGWIADNLGLPYAVTLFCTAITLACLIVFVLIAMLRPKSRTTI